MRTFWGITYYEYRMGVRRWPIWLVSVLAAVTYLTMAWEMGSHLAQTDLSVSMWQLAGTAALLANVLLPVVGGIAIADRLPRDGQLGVRELLRSTPLPRAAYVLGKYAGAVLAVLTPVLLITFVGTALMIVNGAPIALFGAWLAAFLAINLPAYAFIGAFSLACPAVLPVRIYQVLYTGYWFWGNFLNPDFLPTVNGTLLTASGIYAASGFFSTDIVLGTLQGRPPHTALDALLNLAVLAACAAAALVALERYLAWQEGRA